MRYGTIIMSKNSFPHNTGRSIRSARERWS